MASSSDLSQKEDHQDLIFFNALEDGGGLPTLLARLGQLLSQVKKDGNGTLVICCAQHSLSQLDELSSELRSRYRARLGHFCWTMG